MWLAGCEVQMLAAGQALTYATASMGFVYDSLLWMSNGAFVYGARVEDNAEVEIHGLKIFGQGKASSNVGFNATRGGAMTLEGCEANGLSIGAHAWGNGHILNAIKNSYYDNCATGQQAEKDSSIGNDRAAYTYPTGAAGGNTANENAVAGTYGYIGSVPF